MAITLDTPLDQFPGVGEARAKKLEKLGLTRCAQLLTYFPRDYEDRREIYSIRSAPLGRKVCVRAMAAEHPRLARIRRGLELVQLRVVDQAGALHLTFFNQSYVERALRAGEEYIFFGMVEEHGSRRAMVNPIFEPADRRNTTGRIIPVYPLTAGISNHLMLSLTQRAVEACAGSAQETLPPSIRLEHGLAQAEFAYRNIHFPDTFQALELARQRLTFEELFYLSAGLTMLKTRRGGGSGQAVPSRPQNDFLALLPFPPTGAQLRVMEEIAGDMASGRPMNRLVQGDVGSGKTVVAAFAAWLAAGAGYQTALMAPTEVLAEQHWRSLSALLRPAGIWVGLLTGGLTQKEKRETRKALAAGEIDLIIGTHALISPQVEFRRLALIVADEQHRFGVAQRAALAGKSEQGGMPPPHVLVMSATPIPRTLALIIYGDLDVSIIDQLPPGRTPVETYVVHEDKRQRMYNFVRRLVGEGRQAYIICPAVEEKAEDGGQGGQWAQAEARPDLKAVTTYAETLRTQVFPDLRVAFLHGKMRPREKVLLCRRRDRRSGFHHGGGGGGGRAQRRPDRCGERRVLRPQPAPPAPGPGGAREAPVLLRPHHQYPQSRLPGPAAYSGLHNRRLSDRRGGPEAPGARRLLRQPPARPATAGTGRSVGGPPPAPGGPGRCTQSAPERPRPHPAGEPPGAGAGAPAVCRHPGHFQLRSVSLFL